MNDRIRQLTEQAGLYAFVSEDGVDPDIEKFAELLEKEFEAKHLSAGYIDGRSDGIKETAQECLMICKSHKIQSTDDVWYLAHNETINNISENIEKYFGVEE